MLSLDFIKSNRADVERAIRDKGVDLDLDSLLAFDAEARALKTEIDRLRAERNAVSARFKDASPEEKAELGRAAKEAGTRAGELESELSGKETALKALMLRLPGIPFEGAPVGPDESFNAVIRTEGAPPQFDFEPLDHVALIEKNDWADLSRITQVSGSRTYCAQGPARPARDEAHGAGRRSASPRPASRRSAYPRSRGTRPSSTRAISLGTEEDTYSLPERRPVARGDRRGRY